MSEILYRKKLQENMDFMLVWFNMRNAAYDQRLGVNQQYDEVTADNNNITDMRVSGLTKAQLAVPREFL